MPVTTVNLAYKIGKNINIAAAEATGQLCLIRLYFLLRIGEYTLPRVTKNVIQATQIVQFRVGNIGFWRNGSILPRKSPLSLIQQADSATINTTYQKNGLRGQLIHQEALTNGKPIPAKALEERVHHILSNGGRNDDIIAVVCTNRKNQV